MLFQEQDPDWWRNGCEVDTDGCTYGTWPTLEDLESRREQGIVDKIAYAAELADYGLEEDEIIERLGLNRKGNE